MSKNQSPLQYEACDQSHTITFLNPPISSDVNGDRFMRDMGRIQWLAKGNGFEQTKEYWRGVFDPEEYISILRYLDKVSWQRVNKEEPKAVLMAAPGCDADPEPIEVCEKLQPLNDLLINWRKTAEHADEEHAGIFDLCANELQAVLEYVNGPVA